MTDIIEDARRFAEYHHHGQVRKYTGEPYANHLRAVADLVASVSGTPDMVAAAWLHDVIEDTDVGWSELRRYFPDDVVEHVAYLTDVSRPEDGNRAKRKAMDREWISQARPDTKTIKLADLIDNTQSIVEHDPEFARVYLREKAALLEVLRPGNSALYTVALKILRDSTSRMASE